jgi:hypothetical protein
LGLGHPPYTESEIATLNVGTVHRALDRGGLRKSWNEALAGGSLKQMTDGVKVEGEILPRGFVFRNTIAAILIQTGFMFLTLLSLLLRTLGRFRSEDGPLLTLVWITGIAAAASLPNALIAVWLLIRHGTPERSLKRIGTVVVEALKCEGSIDASSDFRVYADHNPDGTVYCWIGGGNGLDQTAFLRALQEVLRPIESPRYLLARKRVLGFFQEDYFAVPDALARRKEFAEVFAAKWNRSVGRAQLVFTRSPEGRLILLRARMHSLASAFKGRAEHVSCWK